MRRLFALRGGTALNKLFLPEPVRPLRLKVEINTHEHFTEPGYEVRRLAVNSRWFAGAADVPTCTIDELMGTKLGALYRRRKG